MASGEGNKRPRDGKPGDGASGASSDGLKSGGERVAKRSGRGTAPARKSRVLPLSVALIALASAGGIVWYGKIGGFGSGGNDGQVPIISASETPERVAPDEPGGLQIPFQDNAVLNNGESAEDKVERILPPPEEPIALERERKPEPDEAMAEAPPSEESDSDSSSPLAALTEEAQRTADNVQAATEDAAEQGDPIGDLVAQVTDGASGDAETPAATAPQVPEPPQATAAPTESVTTTDSASAAGSGADAEAETAQVIPAQVQREVGGNRNSGETIGEKVESLIAKPKQSDTQQAKASDTTQAAKRQANGKKSREFPIVLPPQLPTVDLQGEEGQQAAAPQTANESKPAEPKSAGTQQAAATPAVVTKQVEQPTKKANGQKVESLPTEQKPAQAIQVAQPRMQELPKNSYIIQVAALRSEAEAEGFWSKAQAKHPDLLETMPLYVERADLGDRGIYFRVQTGPFPSKATAQDLCGQLKSAGQDCIVKRHK